MSASIGTLATAAQRRPRLYWPGLRRAAHLQRDVSSHMSSRSDVRPAATLMMAPLSGPLVALAEVPDPVFAQKIVGDGISIDPITSQLLAPCDGQVIQLHRAGHAITLRTGNGLDVLMHIGLDTVDLKGQGFTPKVAVGDAVRAGDTLIEFDADFVATHARSLLTQIIVTAAAGQLRLDAGEGTVRAGEDGSLRAFVEARDRPRHAAAGPGAISKRVAVPNSAGLHARPAAVLATLARTFDADVRLRLRGRDANAKSVVSVMSLEVARGDEVEVAADGADADTAVQRVVSAIAGGLGEGIAVVAPAPAPAVPTGAAEAKPAPRPPSSLPNVLVGAAGSRGVAIGRILQFRTSEIVVPADAAAPAEERA